MFVEPILASEDSSTYLKRRFGHAVLLFSLVSLVYLVVAPAEDGMFRKGFLVETKLQRTQDPYREPDPGPVSPTDVEELNNLFATAAVPVTLTPSATILEPETQVKPEPIKTETKLLKGKKGVSSKQRIPAKTLKVDAVKLKGEQQADGEKATDVPAVSNPVTASLLTRIRADPTRTYIDQEFTVGDLTWTFRNATDFGIEFLVTSRGEALKTYYFPKAVADGYESIMEGSILAPGQRVFGAIPYSGLKNKNDLRITLKTVGVADKKVKVNLSW